MQDIVGYAVPIALAAVAIVLLMGLWNMLRGGSPNLSQTLMRWRVVCGLREVMLTFWPTSRLSSVDLPTLGRPTIAT